MKKKDEAANEAAIELDSNLQSLEAALKTQLARRMPPIMRMIAIKYANGETIRQIAGAVGYKESLVSSYLAEAVRLLRCRPIPDLERTDKSTQSKLPGRDSSAEFSPNAMMVERECESCGATLANDDDRVLVAAMDLRIENSYDDHDLYEERIRLRVGEALHYCPACVLKVAEFRIRNPWHVPAELQREYEKLVSELDAEIEAEDVRRNASLSQRIAAGDMHAFNKAMPTAPSRRDVMATAEQISAVAERALAQTDSSADPRAVSDMADAIMGGEHYFKALRPDGSRTSGEEAQRAKLLEYLNSPTSRGKILPSQRNTLRMWAEGATQSDVARKFHLNQGTISKQIRAALAAAYSK